MPSAQNNSQATVTGVGDACPEPFRVLESPFPSRCSPGTLPGARLQNCPQGCTGPPHASLPGGATSSVPEAACMRSLTSHGTQDWSGSLWLPCSHECKAAAGSRTHSWGRCHRGARACQEAGMGWQAWAIQIPPGWSSGSSHSWSSLHTFHFPPIPAGLDAESQACAGTGPGVGSNSGNLFSLGAVAWPPGLCV